MKECQLATQLGECANLNASWVDRFKVRNNIQFQKRGHRRHGEKGRQRMPSAVPGNFPPCPLCAVQKRKSGKNGLRKCLLTGQPTSIDVTLCIHLECVYYSPSVSLSTVQIDPFISQTSLNMESA